MPALKRVIHQRNAYMNVHIPPHTTPERYVNIPPHPTPEHPQPNMYMNLNVTRRKTTNTQAPCSDVGNYIYIYTYMYNCKITLKWRYNKI